MKKQMMEESLPHMPRKGKNSAAGKLNIPLSTEIVIVFYSFPPPLKAMCTCIY